MGERIVTLNYVRGKYFINLLLTTSRTRLRNLPDHGERIKNLQERIIKEIEGRNEIEIAAQKFSSLNIAAKGIPAVTAMEWTSGKSQQPPDTVVDSDDDEDVDPLKVLAQSREVKLVKVAKPEESLITPADLEEIASFSSAEAVEQKQKSRPGSVGLEPHALYACGMDATFNKDSHTKAKFKPYKTTKTDVHSIDKEKARRQGDKWEATAATPPVLRNSEATVLTMQESIEIQRHQYEASKVSNGSLGHLNETICCESELILAYQSHFAGNAGESSAAETAGSSKTCCRKSSFVAARKRTDRSQ